MRSARQNRRRSRWVRDRAAIEAIVNAPVVSAKAVMKLRYPMWHGDKRAVVPAWLLGVVR